MRPRRQAQQGFALAAILWLLAGLTVLVASIGTSLVAVSRTNRDTQERAQLLLDEQRAVADVAYLTMTNKLLGAGAQVGPKVLLLDGSTRYQSDPQASVGLQDMQGLVGLNSPASDDIARLVPLCGATQQQAGALADALLDYEDADSLKRVNGAEAFEYSAAGMTAPRNRPLADVQELWQVYGWRAIQPKWQAQDCDQWVSLASNLQVNLWTAPKRVLQAVGLSAEQAEAAVADRDQHRDQPLLAPYLLAWREQNDSTGLVGSRYAVRSRGQVRVTVMREGASVARRFVLDRGGYSHVQPFVRSQFEWVPLPQVDPAEQPRPDSYRFTDNLSSFFRQTLTSTNPADAQTSNLPLGRP